MEGRRCREGGYRAVVAHRVGVRAGARCAAGPDTAARDGRGRNHASVDRPVRGATATRRICAGASLWPAWRRLPGSQRSCAHQSVLRDNSITASRWNVARLSRHRRWRVVRDTRRDGLRVAVRPCARSARIRRSPASSIRRGAWRGDPGPRAECGDGDTGSYGARTWREPHRLPDRRRSYPDHAFREYAARRIANRPSPCVVGDDPCHAAITRQPGRCRSGIRADSRQQRSGAVAEPHVRSGRRRCCTLHCARRATCDRDSARAGREWPGGDGGGVRARRVRRVRCAYE